MITTDLIVLKNCLIVWFDIALWDERLLLSPYGEFEILSQKFGVFFLSDLGYQSVDAYQTLVVTVWIPFVDSNEQNGCLQVKKSTFYNVL